MSRERGSNHAFLGSWALLFVASTTITIAWCSSMSAMGPWMRMPGQTWGGVASSFLGMWMVMMVAMMLPSMFPVLWRYRQGLGAAGATNRDRLAALAGLGYFSFWTVTGVVVFLVGEALAAIVARDPALAGAAPAAAAVVVLVVGVIQLIPRRSHPVAVSRCHAPSLDAATAWRHGIRLGVRCGRSCAGLMAVLLLVGMMDLRVMAVVTAAITVERLAPARMRAGQVIGAAVMCVGLLLTARAIGIA